MMVMMIVTNHNCNVLVFIFFNTRTVHTCHTKYTLNDFVHHATTMSCQQAG